MFGLLSDDHLLDHPVGPQALLWAADHAGDGGAASDLRTRKKKHNRPRSGKGNASFQIILVCGNSIFHY